MHTVVGLKALSELSSCQRAQAVVLKVIDMATNVPGCILDLAPQVVWPVTDSVGEKGLWH